MNHEHKCKLIFTIYCLLKLSLIVAYTAILIYLWNYSIAPLIELHGGWNFLWTMLWTSISGAILGALFFMPLPRAPQATHRDNDINNPFPIDLGDQQ